jgi:plasmid stabilization system protein ParE
MIFGFHEDAKEELFAAIEYYESCQLGLGRRFSKEVFATIDRICEHPYAWVKVDLHTRRCILKYFPYGLLYQVVDETISVMAVMHLQRKPDYWNARINDS